MAFSSFTVNTASNQGSSTLNPGRNANVPHAGHNPFNGQNSTQGQTRNPNPNYKGHNYDPNYHLKKQSQIPNQSQQQRPNSAQSVSSATNHSVVHVTNDANNNATNPFLIPPKQPASVHQPAWTQDYVNRNQHAGRSRSGRSNGQSNQRPSGAFASQKAFNAHLNTIVDEDGDIQMCDCGKPDIKVCHGRYAFALADLNKKHAELNQNIEEFLDTLAEQYPESKPYLVQLANQFIMTKFRSPLARGLVNLTSNWSGSEPNDEQMVV
ncbi:hypothetical protein F4778DRAFT_10632 [Xylariomycetidae sp. FL2044]|nr:hypothetical protein F4778DRAFT_10632 [Xylariomycetidae sp. FL2044]